MANFVQYGKVGKPIVYNTLPTPTIDLIGVIAEADGKLYQCEAGPKWKEVASSFPPTIAGFYNFNVGSIPTTEEQQTFITNFRDALTTLETEGIKLYKTKITIDDSNNVHVDYEETTAANFPIILQSNTVVFGIDEEYLNNSALSSLFYLMRGVNYPAFKFVGQTLIPITKELWHHSTDTNGYTLTITYGTTFSIGTATVAPAPYIAITSFD